MSLRPLVSKLFDDFFECSVNGFRAHHRMKTLPYCHSPDDYRYSADPDRPLKDEDPSTHYYSFKCTSIMVLKPSWLPIENHMLFFKKVSNQTRHLYLEFKVLRGHGPLLVPFIHLGGTRLIIIVLSCLLLLRRNSGFLVLTFHYFT